MSTVTEGQDHYTTLQGKRYAVLVASQYTAALFLHVYCKMLNV